MVRKTKQLGQSSKISLSSVSQSSHSIIKDNLGLKKVSSSPLPTTQRRSNHGTQVRKQKYRLTDVTEDLKENEGKLQLHLTKSAPTAQQFREQIVRSREKDRLRYFGVPIKMHDTEEDTIDLSTVEHTADDKTELDIYGSRIIMGKEGRVLALEVKEGLQPVQKVFKSFDVCDCKEHQYSVSEGLTDNPRTRRVFMARVLLTECLFRIPTLVFLLLQFYLYPVHNVMYEHTMLTTTLAVFILLVRVAALSRYKERKSKRSQYTTVITTAAGHCIMFAIFALLLEKHTQSFIEINQFEDPYSLDAYYERRARKFIFSYPYMFGLITVELIIINAALAAVLHCQMLNCIMNELHNGFFLLVIPLTALMGYLGYLLLTAVLSSKQQKLYAFDLLQLGAATVGSGKWTLWRFYQLQRIVKGKIMPIDETMSNIIPLTIAFF